MPAAQEPSTVALLEQNDGRAAGTGAADPALLLPPLLLLLLRAGERPRRDRRHLQALLRLRVRLQQRVRPHDTPQANGPCSAASGCGLLVCFSDLAAAGSAPRGTPACRV